MSDIEYSKENNEGRGSPFSGCFILGAIVFVFGGLIVLYTAVYLKQNSTIDEFTSEEPAEITLLEVDEAEIAEIDKKLFGIKAAVSQGKTGGRFLFTARELNLLIASKEMAKDFRGQTYISGISEQGLIAEMAQPMRKGLFQDGFRYLNARFVLEPELRARTIAFKVRDIQSQKGEIPPAFIQGYAGIDFFKLDPENKIIEEHARALNKVYTEGEHLVVEVGIRIQDAEE